MRNNKRLIAVILLFLLVTCVIAFQLSIEIKEKEQIIITYMNELAMNENDISKLKVEFELEKNAWNSKLTEFQLENTNLIDELKKMNSLMQEVLLDGSEKTPIADSSIPPDILSTILKLYDAMKRNEIKEFQKIDLNGVMTSSYEKRDSMERILWIQHDPENRAKAIQDEFGLNSEVQLLKVQILWGNNTISDSNIAMVKSNGKWIVFKED